MNDLVFGAFARAARRARVPRRMLHFNRLDTTEPSRFVVSGHEVAVETHPDRFVVHGEPEEVCLTPETLETALAARMRAWVGNTGLLRAEDLLTTTEEEQAVRAHWRFQSDLHTLALVLGWDPDAPCFKCGSEVGTPGYLPEDVEGGRCFACTNPDHTARAASHRQCPPLEVLLRDFVPHI